MLSGFKWKSVCKTDVTRPFQHLKSFEVQTELTSSLLRIQTIRGGIDQIMEAREKPYKSFSVSESLFL